MFGSPLENIRHRSCCGKQRHEYERGAERQAETHKEHFGQDKHVYYCVFCNGFHVGGKLKSTARAQLADLSSLLRFDFAAECRLCAVEQWTKAAGAVDFS